jgi:hypothetical protein
LAIHSNKDVTFALTLICFAWVKENILKGRSFWIIEVSPNSSSGWLCDLAKNFLSFEVGDGNSIQMWLDNWHPAGILFEKYGYRVVYDALFSTVISNGGWCWKPAKSDDLVEKQGRLPEVSIVDKDKAIWVPSKKKIYSSSDTLGLIKRKNQVVYCWKIV